MDNAIAGQIADYLIKPVNPSQIIMAIKKIFDADEIKRNKIGQEYSKFSARLNQKLFSSPTWEDWYEIYRDICKWDLTFDDINDATLSQMHFLEKKNCNTEFSHFISEEYPGWIKTDERPNLSFDLISEFVAPKINDENNIYFIVLDCMRLDQFKVIEPYIQELFDVDLKMYYSYNLSCSIDTY